MLGNFPSKGTMKLDIQKPRRRLIIANPSSIADSINSRKISDTINHHITQIMDRIDIVVDGGDLINMGRGIIVVIDPIRLGG
jgi:hypothetical protein